MRIFSIFLILTLSLSAFAEEVCPGGFVPLPQSHLEDMRSFHSMTCKTEITRLQYESCVREPVWRGGVMTIQCEKGRYAGCCYTRYNGNPNSDYKLIRCDSVDTRDGWTAFTDLFRRKKQ